MWTVRHYLVLLLKQGPRGLIRTVAPIFLFLYVRHNALPHSKLPPTIERTTARFPSGMDYNAWCIKDRSPPTKPV